MKDETPKRVTLRILAHPVFARFMPDGDLTESQQIQVRAITGFVYSLLAIGPVFVGLDLMRGWWQMGLPIGLACIGTVPLLYLLRRTGSFLLVGNLISLFLYLALVGNASFNGGLDGGALKWMSVVPLIALLFAGRGSGYIWLVTVCSTFVGFRSLMDQGIFVDITTREEMLSNEVGTLTALALVLFLGFALAEEIRIWLTSRLDAATQARLRSIVDAAGDGILAVDADGKITLSNQAACDILGDDLDGLSIHAVLGSIDLSELSRTRTRVQSEVHRDAGAFPVEITARTLPDATQGLHVLVLRDKTEDKVQRRLLEDARDQAEAANAAKSRFLANMSHELRTPLNAVIGYTEMLVEEVEDGESIDTVTDLARIHEAGRHLLALINDILDLSKVESETFILDWQDVALETLLRNLDATISPIMKREGNAWSVHSSFAGTNFMLRTDPTRLLQVLMNLLSNAAKFTQQGSVRLEVTSPDERWVEFVVRDTGIGMSQTQQEHVWEEFAQADASTTRMYGGTGLGLPLSRRLAAKLGGDLSMTSALGEGTCVVLRVPQRRDA